MTITIKEVREQYEAHHTAMRRGYVSRKTEGYVISYKGKFGEGYAVISPRWDTTIYSDITYYTIKK